MRPTWAIAALVLAVALLGCERDPIPLKVAVGAPLAADDPLPSDDTVAKYMRATIAVTPATPVYEVGRGAALEAKLTGPGGRTEAGAVTWSSSDPSVLDVQALDRGGVSQRATFIARRTGTATITVTLNVDHDVQGTREIQVVHDELIFPWKVLKAGNTDDVTDRYARAQGQVVLPPDFVGVAALAPGQGVAWGGRKIVTTVDDGGTWLPVPGPDDRTALGPDAVAMRDPRDGLVATGGALWHTADAGATWQPVELDGEGGPRALQRRGDELVAWGDGPVLWRSHDGGATWMDRPTPDDRPVALARVAGRDTWVLGDGDPRHSGDDQPWDPPVDLPPEAHEGPTQLAFGAGDVGWLYAPSTGYLGQLTGGTVAARTPRTASGVAVSLRGKVATLVALDATHAAVQVDRRFLQTEDGGTVWAFTNFPATQRTPQAFALSDPTHGFAAGPAAALWTYVRDLPRR